MIRRELLLALLVANFSWLLAQAPLECLPELGSWELLSTTLLMFLSVDDEAEFNQMIRSLNDTTPNSIVVVTHPDFCGEEPFEFATGVGERWGVGDAQFDNGVVVAISPKTIERRGQVFIAVGYGLEGILPDATVNRIIDNEVIPEFKVGGPDAYAWEFEMPLRDWTTGQWRNPRIRAGGSVGCCRYDRGPPLFLGFCSFFRF